MEISAAMNNYDVPKLLVHLASPSHGQPEPFHIPCPSTRHLNIVEMHHSQSAPETASRLELFNRNLTRETRSQSVPLSLNAVQISKKIVDISDKFNEKQSGIIRRSRTSSEGDNLRSNLPKRQSDLVQQWLSDSTKPNTNIGSAV